VYWVVVYPEVADQIAELPAAALADYARVLDTAAANLSDGAPARERKHRSTTNPHRLPAPAGTPRPRAARHERMAAAAAVCG
jgi:hypothetical protein